jgi:dipeptidyl aminopeptidase/acylaminoacyl peptidase
MLRTLFTTRSYSLLLCALFGISMLAADATQSLRFNANAQQQDEKKDEKKEEKKEELMLKPEGKVAFTTDEGTWMSLDVSPDGQTIVFDLLGDIYTLPIAGGEARRIVGGMSFESQPKFSPDGKLIVFTSDRSGAEQLWVSKPDGSDPKPVTKGRGPGMLYFLSPSWTHDGAYILASGHFMSICTTRTGGRASVWARRLRPLRRRDSKARLQGRSSTRWAPWLRPTGGSFIGRSARARSATTRNSLSGR